MLSSYPLFNDFTEEKEFFSLLAPFSFLTASAHKYIQPNTLASLFPPSPHRAFSESSVLVLLLLLYYKEAKQDKIQVYLPCSSFTKESCKRKVIYAFLFFLLSLVYRLILIRLLVKPWLYT